MPLLRVLRVLRVLFRDREALSRVQNAAALFALTETRQTDVAPKSLLFVIELDPSGNYQARPRLGPSIRIAHTYGIALSPCDNQLTHSVHSNIVLLIFGRTCYVTAILVYVRKQVGASMPTTSNSCPKRFHLRLLTPPPCTPSPPRRSGRSRAGAWGGRTSHPRGACGPRPRSSLRGGRPAGP